MSNAPVEAASTGSQDASGKPVVLVSLLVSLMVTSMCILAYDRFVRVPSTPRLGTVDVGEIFAANQAKTLKTVIATKAQVDPNALGTQAGQQMAQQLQAFSKSCDCLLIASPAVFGTNRAIPDFTAAIKATNGLTTTLRDLGLSAGPMGAVQPAPPAVSPASAAGSAQ
jgi:hypothetical protein